MNNFFEVENADAPPSLSKHGVLRTGQKSDLVQCLEVDFPSDFAGADIELIDGANYFLRPDKGIHIQRLCSIRNRSLYCKSAIYC